ncbi:MAG TPA: FAD-dependent oxidoreductase, partial [Acidimicrobiales bacterium]|nr:FAD-dependent oxidoreductase [Acidimicrobiales bacterium]
DHLRAANGADLAKFRQCGMVTLKTIGGHHLKVVPHFDSIGIPYEDWGHQEFRSRLPELDLRKFGPPKRPDDDEFWNESSEFLDGGLFTPEAGYISDPQLAAHNLHVAADTLGCEFRFNTEITAIQRDNGRVTGVGIGDGSVISTPIVVNAAGPHSSVVNAMAGAMDDMSIGTSPLRQEVHHVPSPDELDFQNRGFSIADDDTGIYVRPDVGDNILIGSTEPDCDPLHWVEPDHEGQIDASQWEAQVLRLNRRLPTVGIPHQRRGIVGVYDVSSDWIPIYDRTCVDGYYVAIGTSGNQFKNAAIAGYCMSELIGAVENGHDHDSDPVSIVGPHTGLSIDMGNFRRTRSVNPDSSMSVHG